MLSSDSTSEELPGGGSLSTLILTWLLSSSWAPQHGWLVVFWRLSYMIAALPLTSLAITCVAVYVTAYAMKRRMKVQLASQKARWHGLAQGATAFSVSESMTLGWLNVLLRHTWPTLLEKEISEVVSKQIRESIQKILSDGRNKTPMKYFQTIELEGFTLGVAPPRFQSCQARYDPTHNLLQLEVDMNFQSSGFQCILAPKMRAADSLMASMAGRAEISHFAVSGRVVIGLHMSSRTPGIRGVDFSFMEPPVIDVQFSPLAASSAGFAFTNVPGVLGIIQSRIQKVLSKDMIEPRRKFTDTMRVWDKVRAKRSGGPGGLLCLTVVQARELRYTESGQKSAVVDPYVEVRAGAEVYRTPCVHGTPAPAFNWDFDLRLPALLGEAGALDSIRVKVLDAKALGDPGVLGEARLSLNSLGLVPNSPPLNLWLPLEGSRLGAVHLQVVLLQKTPTEKPLLARSSCAGKPRDPPGSGPTGALVGSVAIVGAEGTTGREELRALLASEQARRMLAEKRLADVTSTSAPLPPLRPHDRYRRSDQGQRSTRATWDVAGSPGVTRANGRHGQAAFTDGPLVDVDDHMRQTTSDEVPPADTVTGGAAAAASPSEPSKHDPQQHSTSDRLGAAGTAAGERERFRADNPTSAAAPKSSRLAATAVSSGPLSRSGPLLPSASSSPHLSDTERPLIAPTVVRQLSDGNTAGAAELQPRLDHSRQLSGILDASHSGMLHYKASGKETLEGADSGTSTLSILQRVATLESSVRLTREQANRDAEVAEANIRQLELELATEHRRRLSEQLRAIIEGATFTMHKASDSSGRHVWFSPSNSALKWAVQRVLPGSSGPLPEKNRERSVAVKHIADVVKGARLFPHQQSRGWVGLKTLVAGLTKSEGPEGEAPSHVDSSRCFSIILSGNSTVHLEVPPGGNGRSRDEWVSAFADLAAHSYKPLLKDQS